MRSRSGILAVLAVATLLAGVATGQPVASRVVHDLRGRFTIIVPVTWHIKQLSKGDPALGATGSEEAGTLPDSVDVVVRGAPVGMSPEGCIHQVEWITQHLLHICSRRWRRTDDDRRPARVYAYAYVADADGRGPIEHSGMRCRGTPMFRDYRNDGQLPRPCTGGRMSCK